MTTGRWPVMAPSSSTAVSSSFGFVTASPRPMLMVILVSRGASIGFARLNSVHQLLPDLGVVELAQARRLRRA